MWQRNSLLLVACIGIFLELAICALVMNLDVIGTYRFEFEQQIEQTDFFLWD